MRARAVSDDSLYKDLLMQHYRHPHNRGDIDNHHVIRRASNPRCGDDLEVGVRMREGCIESVRFRGRGCSVCIASASMMTEVVTGADRDAALGLATSMRDWFSSGDGSDVSEPPGSLAALAAVKQYPARRRCVLLAWEALECAIEDESLETEGEDAQPAA